MRFVSNEKKTVRGTECDHATKKCPKPTCAVGKIIVSDWKWIPEGISHLSSCYGTGLKHTDQDALIKRIYVEALQVSKSAGSTICSHLKTDSLSNYENIISSYVHLIILENCPFKIASSQIYCRFNRFDFEIGIEQVKETFIKIISLVEKKMQKDLKHTRGALIIDGWSKRSLHNVALLASYMHDVPVKKSDVMSTEFMRRLSLVALSSMAKLAP